MLVFLHVYLVASNDMTDQTLSTITTTDPTITMATETTTTTDTTTTTEPKVTTLKQVTTASNKLMNVKTKKV